MEESKEKDPDFPPTYGQKLQEEIEGRWEKAKRFFTPSISRETKIPEKEDQAKRQYIIPSDSVESMKEALAGEPRYAYELVHYIFRSHSIYAGPTKWQPPDKRQLLNEQRKFISTWKYHSYTIQKKCRSFT